MRMPIIISLLVFAVLSANAHHATVANFTQELITVEGVIEQVRYQNPHSSILIKHTSKDEEETYWLVETGAKTTLERKGVNLDRLTIGSYSLHCDPNRCSERASILTVCRLARKFRRQDAKGADSTRCFCTK